MSLRPSFSMFNVFQRALFIVLVCAVLSACQPEELERLSIKNVDQPELEAANKLRVRAILQALENNDTQALSPLLAADYIQHNLAIEDGRQGLIDFLNSGVAQFSQARPVRMVADNDIVATHVDYVLNGLPFVAYEVWRFEDGLAVEHWDNFQPKIPLANLSGHTLLSGPTEIRDLEQEANNKNIVYNFLQRVKVEQRIALYSRYVNVERYIDHGFLATDSSLLNIARLWLNRTSETGQLIEVHYLLGEGNMVFALAQSATQAVFEIYRVEADKIVERWPVSMNLFSGEAQNNNSQF